MTFKEFKKLVNVDDIQSVCLDDNDYDDSEAIKEETYDDYEVWHIEPVLDVKFIEENQTHTISKLKVYLVINEETIQIKKDRSWEFDIGDYITFDESSNIEFRKFNTIYEVIGYNKPNNIRVKIIKDRNLESGRIANIDLSTEYPYITKLHINV